MGDGKSPAVGGPALESGDLATPAQEVDPVAVGPGDPQGDKVSRGPAEDQEIAALWKLGAEKLGRDWGALGQEGSGVLELGNGQRTWAGAEGRGDGEFRFVLARALEALGEGEARGGHLKCEDRRGGGHRPRASVALF